ASYYHLTTQSLMTRINKLRWPTPYLIQQGIKSITKTGQPFDIRVHLLRVNKKWIVVGAVGRVAPLGQIVSTGCRGEKSYRLETLFTRQLNYSTPIAKIMAAKLAQFSLQVAYAYEKF